MEPSTTDRARSPGEGECRFCRSPLSHTVVDLGMSPLCESFLTPDQLNGMERFFPLHVFVCEDCFLVQLQEYVSPEEIFSDDYAYFSSYSKSWLDHGRRYTEGVIERLGLAEDSRVVEIASNDGYLLQHFVARGIPCLGVEPAANVAAAARAKGVETREAFFGTEEAENLVSGGWDADLLIGNNVLAHVHELNDFVKGISIALAPDGVATLEFPHLMRLIEGNQFDTIYHEHFSYLSLLTVERVFHAHGLTVFDVEELKTHGGSLRIYASRAGEAPASTERLEAVKEDEQEAGVWSLEYYRDFQERVHETKRALLEFLIEARRAGQSVVAYGAPGKGNTLLNYCGIRTDFLDYAVDLSDFKQGRFTPGTHIPIYHPSRIRETRPQYVLILPWNLKDEIMDQMADIREWGARFVVPIPSLKVLE